MKPRNPARRSRLYAAQFTGPFPGYDHAEAIRAMPCSACSACAPSEPHHVKSRGAGGKWSDMVPLCSDCHRRVHQHGRGRFELWSGVNLARWASILADAARARQ